ncbi:condensation domain-containing protein, partial [Flavitalea flava]
AAIWEELLGVDRIGIHDNFFELGGHSLLAIRLVSSIRKEIRIEVTIGDIFDYPAIGLLAVQLNATSGRTSLPPLIRQERSVQTPLSFSQERLWVIDQLEGSVSYHIPVVLRLRGQLNEDALRYALQGIVNRHEILRTVIEAEEGHAYQRVVEAGGWKLESSEPGGSMQDPASWRSYIGGLISRPFDLAADYKLRA